MARKKLQCTEFVHYRIFPCNISLIYSTSLTFETDQFLDFVSELETTPYSMGRNSTQLWLREFLDYWQYFSSNQSQFYTDLRGFLTVSFNRQWSSYLRYDDDDPYLVSRFYFTTGFRIDNWNARTDMLLRWRNITARYPEYQALVYDENNFYSDQVIELPVTTLRSLGIAVVVMCVVCTVFIGDLHIVFWVVFTLLSMDIGVAGYLSLWGADLSPTTVVNILMSIGLSIDFATHVGYRIYRTHRTVPCQNLGADDRLAGALGAIAWPVVQGGVSTLLAIGVMLLVGSHVVRMFARTTILIVSFGIFHGIVLLPVLWRTFVANERESI